QHRLGAVAKSHVVEFNRVLEGGNRAGARSLLDVHVRVHHFEDTTRGRHGLLKVVVDLGQVLDRSVKPTQGKEKAQELSGVQGSPGNLIARINHENGGGEGSHHFHHWRGKGNEPGPPKLLTLNPFQGLCETANFVVLHPKSHHNTVPSDGLLQDIREIG